MRCQCCHKTKVRISPGERSIRIQNLIKSVREKLRKNKAGLSQKNIRFQGFYAAQQVSHLLVLRGKEKVDWNLFLPKDS